MIIIRPGSSGERGARRSTALRPITQLRGANVGRRRMRCGRLNSGEAAVVGGDRLFGMFSSGRKAPVRRKYSAPMRRALIGGK